MKLLILLLTFSFSAFSQVIDYPVYYDDQPMRNYKYNRLTDYFNLEVIVYIDSPYRPYPDKDVFEFKKKIATLSYEYTQLAKQNHIYTYNPIHKFVFMMRNPAPNQKFAGLCLYNNNTIFLEKNFKRGTFYHELGHCDLGYGHVHDENLKNHGVSSHIMSWYFNDHFSENAVKHFFNPYNHVDIFAKEATINHNAMIKSIEHFKETYVRNK